MNQEREGFESIEGAVCGLIEQALNQYLEDAALEAPESVEVVLEEPRKPEHGDWALSLPMKLARPLRRNPFEIAQGIAERIEANELIEAPVVARPGFINLRLAVAGATRLIRHVVDQGEAWGRTGHYKGHRVIVEFVSANPTGPMHIGHCRGAVVGDALARIMEAAGYEVCREYYYNDAGVQMKKLGESLRARYLEALGRPTEMPEDGYQGDYILELAERLKAERGDQMTDQVDTGAFTDYATEKILKMIDADLERLRIHFDHYFSETTLHKDGRVKDVLDRLKAEGHIYPKDGAWWLRTTAHGDEEDRVVIKSDGEYTYLAPDIAYHQYKFERGFDRLIDVLGADHHGYVPRLKAAIEALGYRAEQLDVLLVQMVGVKRAGEVAKLSTRAGDFLPLSTVLEEVGPDVTRFLFLMRSTGSQMTFDFEMAKDTSMDNPVYYVQYAHARCCSLLRKAEDMDQGWNGAAGADLSLLGAAEEVAIVRQMDRIGRVVLQVARQAEPMLMTAYLTDLATAFHGYFTAGNRDGSLRVIQPGQPDLTQARLTLIVALRQTLANGLRMLGVEPLERL